MPITVAPVIDDRKYQDLLDEALARIPVHNPEWTNFNRSDPGVTLIELFAFLTENLLYRANQIPERNRRKFLSLLGVPLQPGAAATGIVAFTNERGSLATITLSPDLEVRAGEVAFRTTQAVDVLPIETRIFWKRERQDVDEQLKKYYRDLYASYRTDPVPPDLKLYDTVAFTDEAPAVIDLGQTVDRSLWIAFLVRASDKQLLGLTAALNKVRDEIAQKTLTLGLVPALDAASRQLRPGQGMPEGMPLVQYRVPKVQPGGGLRADRKPEYRLLDATPGADVLAVPGVVQITLPRAGELAIWNDLDPLDAGAGDFPPTLEDTAIEERLITWLRIQPAASAPARFLWTGINAATVVQRVHVLNELLPAGTGRPDQVVTLARTPVVPGTVTITVEGSRDPWREIDDLNTSGPEVPSPDLRTPPGVTTGTTAGTDVFTVDPESGVVRFGDGAHGRRPPEGAAMRATYDYSVGAAGNVGAGSINTGPSLPPAVKVTNPVRTWGGSSRETVEQGEKQVSRYLQHRDRAVTSDDFKTIVERTPGVDIGRVEVLPAYNPRVAQDEPGGAPGAVTLLVIPRFDPVQPDAPRPDRLFVDAICRYLDPRRLVTTEVFVYGPSYQSIWVSVGIKVVGGMSVPQVREAVRQELLDFLSPLAFDRATADLTRHFDAWPLRKPVVDRELMAVASRVKGVMLINNVLVAGPDAVVNSEIPMRGLQLPHVAGISVVDGDPVGIEQLRGAAGEDTGQAPGAFVPVPIIPERC